MRFLKEGDKTAGEGNRFFCEEPLVLETARRNS